MKRAAVMAAALVLTSCATKAPVRSAPSAPDYAAQFRTDLHRAARAFMDGALSGREYLEFSRDRARKWQALQHNVEGLPPEGSGDSDRDGVPDHIDRCATPPMQATTGDGCPLPSSPPCDEANGRCGPTAQDDEKARDILAQISFMYDPKCEGAPTPQTPEPLEWGRGQQPSLNDAGYNMSLTQVSNQAADCRLYYEIEMEVLDIGATVNPKHARSVFRSTEDLRPTDARRVVFGVDSYESSLPGRQRMIDMFGRAEDIRWRARAVNGMGRKSPWSEWRVQGPASAGVHGGDV